MVCMNDKETLERGSRCGASAVIPRPFKSDLLLAKAKQLLNVCWRETYRVLLSVSVGGNSSGQLFFCRSLDVSITGMLIETEQTFALGDRLVCNFFLPDATRIGVTGEIVRLVQETTGSKVNRYGVQFSALAPETKKAIEAFIASKAQ
jgi:Tfp pilus assembly protein PilZ